MFLNSSQLLKSNQSLTIMEVRSACHVRWEVRLVCECQGSEVGKSGNEDGDL